ncbi:MAG: response regulator [Deltaproteobacteria bacterium]|nr:response regulator [Deltaproteobacteria bacterium]
MGKRILIIDDEHIILELLAIIFGKEGYEVDAASSGAGGLKMAYSKEYDIIISDIDMPVMSGIEFYRKLIEKIPSMKQRVLFITGNDDRETFMFLNETGVKYLLKPFKPMDIVKAVTEVGDFTNSKTSRFSE